MKKLLAIILFWFCICAFAAPVIDVLQQVSPPCSTVQFAEDGIRTTQNGVAQYSASRYRAQQFVYTGTNGKQICILNLWLDFQGSNSHKYFAAIYDDNSNLPGNQIGVSDIKELNSIGGSETKVQFDLSTPSSALSNSSTYWVALYSTTVSSSDFTRWHMEDNGTTERNAYSSDGSSWSGVNDTRTYKFELVSQ